VVAAIGRRDGDPQRGDPTCENHQDVVPGSRRLQHLFKGRRSHLSAFLSAASRRDRAL